MTAPPIALEDRAEPPRPIIWAYALLFGLLFTNVIFLAVARVTPDYDPRDEFSRTRLEEISAAPTADKITVIMIGDSKMMFGTVPDLDFSARLSRLIGTEAIAIRVISYGNTLLPIAPLLELVRDVGPDVIVLQRDLYGKELTIATKHQTGRKFASGVFSVRPTRR